MSEQPLDSTEENIRAAARAFAYPPTPNVASGVRRRLAGPAPAPLRLKLALTAAAVVAVFASLLAVPEVRAGLVEILRVGAVRIFLVAPTPTGAASGTPQPTATLSPPLASALDLAGETTFAEAQARARFTIPLPSYPADLGQPDRVYLQEMGAPVVMLVWLEPGQPDRVRLSLHVIGPGSFAISKIQPRVIRQTSVNGGAAVWAEGPYMVETRNGNYVERWLVSGRVLIWQSGDVTYRLETDRSLEEAVKIAESLK